MNDTTQTPTDQPSELDAIRARVDWIEKARIIMNAGLLALMPVASESEEDERARSFLEGCIGLSEIIEEQCKTSRRLLELLDERDAIIEHEQFISASLEATYDTMKARNVKHSFTHEEELGTIYRVSAVTFRKLVRSAVANYMRSEGCSCCRDSEAHKKLKEARELMREWYDGLPTYDLAWLESLKIRVKKFIEGN